MDRLDVMRLFTRIVERHSFTLAAQDLEWPRSTATQVIQDLEKRLGVRLLQRTTRHVKATLDGEAYYRRCVTILGEVEDAEAAFSDAKPRGLLRIDVHGTLTRHFVLPALPAFLAKYPDLQLHIGEGDRLVDLVREGIDCVLRVGDLQDSAMIGRRVALLEEVTCASPAYMAHHGTPVSVDDLAGHVSIGFMSSASGMALPLEFTVNGELRNVNLHSTVTVTSAETYVAAAKLGLGLIQVPRYHVQADLAAGTLVSVLPDFPPSPTPVSLLYPHSRQLSPRVRVFIDWVTQALAPSRQDIQH
ncbi:LysR family transcriptional regulator [Dyella lipolytica]|uniref:LysR family transcriptional regulator n=1 Tax=Dyella lipolytica TaxID=1867835 RepID=A0ABW8IQK1_9GAMM|nr:LysR family transcriptional regulator [Dyella lipolytica]GLQ47167.1 LysR family transcriptional regulator [Dyella lipolytica]